MAPQGGHLNKRKQEPQKHSGSKTEKKTKQSSKGSNLFVRQQGTYRKK